MLGRSRVTKTPDTRRIGEAVSFPGIDPRTWVSLAVVTNVVTDAEGPLVDIVLLPGGKEETARVGAEYAGSGFGFYLPLDVDDTVLVTAPNGNPDEGLVVVKRMWEAADPPPAELAANPSDVLLVVKPGKTLRIKATGGGNVAIVVEGDGKVLLGAETGTSPVARVGDATTITGLDLTHLQTMLDARYALGASAPLTPIAGTVAAGSSKVEAE